MDKILWLTFLGHPVCMYACMYVCMCVFFVYDNVCQTALTLFTVFSLRKLYFRVVSNSRKAQLTVRHVIGPLCVACSCNGELNSTSSLQYFYRAMLRRARYCYGKLSVCPSVRPSVCLSVTLRYCDYIGWKSSKIISWLVSLGCSLFAIPTSRGYSKGNTPKFLPEQGWGAEKVGLSVQKL